MIQISIVSGFQLLITGLTPVSLLERESGFEIVTQLPEDGFGLSSDICIVNALKNIKKAV
jgi:hypothetical protein